MSNSLPSVPFLVDVAATDSQPLCERLDALRAARYESADRTLLEGPVAHVDIDRLRDVPAGRFDTSIGSAHFACFYRANDERPHEYLYVVLDLMRTDDAIAHGPLPSFPKWSWHTHLAGDLLCIEDPLYFDSDIPVGWFYGTETEDYRAYVARLVEAVADATGVPHNRIIFSSLSAGGSASIFAAAHLPGSCAVALNPQLDLTRFIPRCIDDFARCTGIDLRAAKERGERARIDAAATIERAPHTRFLIVENCRSAMDFDEQLLPLCAQLGIEPRYGLTQQGNVALWTVDVPTKHPHVMLESKTLSHALDFLAKELLAGHDLTPYQGLYTLIGELWHDSARALTDLAANPRPLDPLAQLYETLG